MLPKDAFRRLALSVTCPALALASGWAAQAQTVQPPDPGPPAAAPELPAPPMIEFSADELSYDENMDVVTATGNVLVQRDGQRLSADTVTYDRASGAVTASGNVLLDDGDGSRAVGDSFELTDTLKDGAVSNVLLILSDQSRLAARSGEMEDGRVTLDHAVYSPCAVVNSKGCPIRPLWQLKAVRVVHDPARGRVYYKDARLEMFGVPVAVLPSFSHPDNFDHSRSGVLQPDFGLSRELGGEIRIPWLWAIAPDRDLKVTANLFTGAVPVLGLDYRQLLRGGPIHVGGLVTYARGRVEDLATGNIVETPSRLRGAIDANGRIEHGNGWRSTFSTRLTNDDNFLGRYQVSLDTRLRSTYALENFQSSADVGERYFAVRGWYYQDLRQDVQARNLPVALPLIDLLWRLPGEKLGGNVVVQANSLGLYRRDGQSMARALALVRWDRSLITGLGQRLTLTGLLRGDIYNTFDSALADEAVYAGRDGWRGRVIPLVAADLQWPFAGALFGGTQTLTPRLQFVASAPSTNSGIPNEDSRAIDLEDANLFALNRFPGYDRWEGGARITYGAEWRWTGAGMAIDAQLGQSYRLDGGSNLFPQGTGLSDRLSDFVGRATLRIGQFVEITERLRVDKNSLAVRRNEVDIAIGSRSTFVSLGYFKYNRKIELEDLTDHQEVRAGGRVAFAKYWSLYGSTVIDLTGRGQDPLATADGFQPIRHRLGVNYRDECFEFGIGWRRNYVDNPNARQGNTLEFTLKLRNLG